MIGRVYSIALKDDLNTPLYVGSTIRQLSYRWSEHKKDYKRWIDGKGHFKSSFALSDQYGIDTLDIILIKEYIVVDKRHLQALEQLWISKFKIKTQDAAFRINRLSDRQRYLENREHILKRNDEYRERNKDAVKEKAKEYRESNKDMIKAKKSEKIRCECGGSWTKGHGVKRHEKTSKHQTWQSSLT